MLLLLVTVVILPGGGSARKRPMAGSNPCTSVTFLCATARWRSSPPPPDQNMRYRLAGLNNGHDIDCNTRNQKNPTGIAEIFCRLVSDTTGPASGRVVADTEIRLQHNPVGTARSSE